jgi:hypothetical protein
MRTGLEKRGIVAGAGEDWAGSVVQAVPDKLGPDGTFGVIADYGCNAAVFVTGGQDIVDVRGRLGGGDRGSPSVSWPSPSWPRSC